MASSCHRCAAARHHAARLALAAAEGAAGGAAAPGGCQRLDVGIVAETAGHCPEDENAMNVNRVVSVQCGRNVQRHPGRGQLV